MSDDYKARLDAEYDRVKPRGKEGPKAANGQGPKDGGPLFKASPWWRDPSTIPPRSFLFGRHYIRGAVGATIAAGGRGKTTQGIFEAVCMATGRDLSTGQPLASGPLRVWSLNGEEDQDELDRRVSAVLQRYSVSQTDLGGRLFVQSVRELPITVATVTKNAPAINDTIVDAMKSFIERNQIDVMMVDPLVSFHSVPENNNVAMDLVIKRAFGAIAQSKNVAVELFHHPGKPKPGQADSTVEDGRGASAILWAVRSARTLNFMAPEEATKLGIPEDERRQHVRIADGKANLAPLGKATWIKLTAELLPNGDAVACSSSWDPPDPFAGITSTDMELARQLARTGAYRADYRSPDWFGYALADQLGIAVAYEADNDPKDVARLKSIIAMWLKSKVILKKPGLDEQRRTRSFIVPGPFQADATTPTYDGDDIVLQ